MNKQIPFMSAVTPAIITVIALILSVFYLKIPLFIPLLFGYMITLFVAVLNKAKLRSVLLASLKSVKSIFVIFIILILIGILIAIWSSSGTIDALVYYGLMLINPKYLVVISFLISSGVSFLLGTSVGTASTVGVAFMGMAYALGINPSIVAGAIVSGAFVGDRTSPLSSAAQINTVVTETDYYENIKELFKTLIPVIIISGIIYFLIGEFGTNINSDSKQLVLEAKNQLLAVYTNIPLVLLLPPLSIMILALFRIPVRINLIIGILIGAVLAYIFQEKRIIDLLSYAIFGFIHQDGHVFGGAWNMFNQIILIFISGAFYGLLDSSGILSAILEKMTNGFNDSTSVIRTTMLISISSALLTSTQVMAILIPGKVMGKYYKELGLTNNLLNRTISDSGMVVAGLIPWNLNAVMLGIALNISVVRYIPFAFLLFILPIYSFYFYKWGYYLKEKTVGRNFAKKHE